jgi:UDP-N-acetylglucosamine pyrophosphorylase
MTSEFTDAETREFFERRKFFGLGEKSVVFFQQGTMPCVDLQGKLLLETAGKVRASPALSSLHSFALHPFGWKRGLVIGSDV